MPELMSAPCIMHRGHANTSLSTTGLLQETVSVMTGIATLANGTNTTDKSVSEASRKPCNTHLQVDGKLWHLAKLAAEVLQLLHRVNMSQWSVAQASIKLHQHKSNERNARIWSSPRLSTKKINHNTSSSWNAGGKRNPTKTLVSWPRCLHSQCNFTEKHRMQCTVYKRQTLQHSSFLKCTIASLRCMHLQDSVVISQAITATK